MSLQLEICEKIVESLDILYGIIEFNDCHNDSDGQFCSDGETGDPVFKSYDDSQKWLDKKYTQYGGKNKFTSSPEYAKAYPKIIDIYKKDMGNQAATAMKQSGVKFGDRVKYDVVGSFGNVKKQDGFIKKDKFGLPVVKLDVGGTTKWHKGFKK